MEPTIERFRALARSSPWRWRTLRLSTGGDVGDPQHGGQRVWVARPDRFRLERLDGTVLRAGVEQRDPRSVAILASDGRGHGGLPPRVSDLDPVLDADGLVAERPSGLTAAPDPMFGGYFWAALLDPVELADGLALGSARSAEEPAAEVVEIRGVDHHGREAWEAVVRPTAAYDPGCRCCPLLTVGERHRVRLDVGTGVCVLVEKLPTGSSAALRIEAADEEMDDDLFVAPPRPRGLRRLLLRGP